LPIATEVPAQQAFARSGLRVDEESRLAADRSIEKIEHDMSLALMVNFMPANRFVVWRSMSAMVWEAWSSAPG
jgi:hypothetical protein